MHLELPPDFTAFRCHDDGEEQFVFLVSMKENLLILLASVCLSVCMCSVMCFWSVCPSGSTVVCVCVCVCVCYYIAAAIAVAATATIVATAASHAPPHVLCLSVHPVSLDSCKTRRRENWPSAVKSTGIETKCALVLWKTQTKHFHFVTQKPWKKCCPNTSAFDCVDLLRTYISFRIFFFFFSVIFFSPCSVVCAVIACKLRI